MDIPIQAQLLSLRATVESTLAAERDVVRQQPGPDARWAPGDRMSARVEAALPGGRFHVLVDDVLLEMQLPEGFEPGDRVNLEFVSGEPRPSFLLREASEALPETQVALSRSGRQLDEIIKSVAPERSSTPVPVKASQPLLPAATAEAPKLAQALAQALTRSGLFYESHQAEWVLGQRVVDELLQEPQGRLSQLLSRLSTGSAATATAETSPEATSSDRIAAAPSARDAQPGDLPVQRPDSRPQTVGLAESAGNHPSSSALSVDSPKAAAGMEAPRAADVVHPEATPQVRSQLDALDTRQMVWQGQLWPGQHLEWTINDPAEDPAASAQEAQPWFTALRLRLPRLGELSADLALIGPALRVRLAASEPHAQAEMSEGRAALAERLAGAGIDLVSFTVAGRGDD